MHSTPHEPSHPIQHTSKGNNWISVNTVLISVIAMFLVNIVSDRLKVEDKQATSTTKVEMLQERIVSLQTQLAQQNATYVSKDEFGTYTKGVDTRLATIETKVNQAVELLLSNSTVLNGNNKHNR